MAKTIDELRQGVTWNLNALLRLIDDHQGEGDPRIKKDAQVALQDVMEFYNAELERHRATLAEQAPGYQVTRIITSFGSISIGFRPEGADDALAVMERIQEYLGPHPAAAPVIGQAQSVEDGPKIVIRPTRESDWEARYSGFDPSVVRDGASGGRGRSATLMLASVMRSYDLARGVTPRPVDSQIVLRPGYDGGWDLIKEYLPGSDDQQTLQHGGRMPCLVQAIEAAAEVGRVLAERKQAPERTPEAASEPVPEVAAERATHEQHEVYVAYQPAVAVEGRPGKVAGLPGIALEARPTLGRILGILDAHCGAGPGTLADDLIAIFKSPAPRKQPDAEAPFVGRAVDRTKAGCSGSMRV